MKNLVLISITLSVAALIGLAYTQNLYREALTKINALEKKVFISKNGSGNSLQASNTTNTVLQKSSIPHKPLSSEGNPTQLDPIQSQQNPQKLLPVIQETGKFYTMFKDAMERYSGEWKQKYVKSELKRYKKKLGVNDLQWQFVQSILKEYLEKRDEIFKSLSPDDEDYDEDYTEYWKILGEKRGALKHEYATKLFLHLTNQQIENFKKMN